MKVVRNWNMLPREAVDDPFLNMFKTSSEQPGPVKTALSMEGGLGLDDFNFPTNTNHCKIM